MIRIRNDFNNIEIENKFNRLSINGEANTLTIESVDIESETFFLSQFQTYREDKEVIYELSNEAT